MTYNQPSAEIVALSPKMAQEMLAKNTSNRPVSKAHVEKLRREMESGRWAYNGEAIKWSVDGVLLDGQHRLTALSHMGDGVNPVPFLVVRGLPADTQHTMDQGKIRGAGDQLAITGMAHSNAKTIGGAIRVYVEWETGDLLAGKWTSTLSNPQIVEWARQHPVQMMIFEDLVDSRLRRVKARPSVTAAVMLRFREIDDEAQREFAEMLYTGAGLHEGHPVLVLRERLDRIRETRTRAADKEYVAFFVMAWNAWREGKTVLRLQRPRTGTWTRDNFPEPR